MVSSSHIQYYSVSEDRDLTKPGRWKLRHTDGYPGRLYVKQHEPKMIARRRFSLDPRYNESILLLDEKQFSLYGLELVIENHPEENGVDFRRKNFRRPPPGEERTNS